MVKYFATVTRNNIPRTHRVPYRLTNIIKRKLPFQNISVINSIQFSLFPAHINVSYNNDNVHITCRKRGGQKTMLMNVRPLTITVVNYEHNYN